METIRFRNLKAEEIQVRPTDTKFKGSATLLLYKDSRVDMNILDETVGTANWQKEFYEAKGNLYCRVGLHIGDEWVWKSDCGMESNIDAAKGEASDSFKRACVNWGIGRELYTTPRIKINCPDSYYYNDKLTMTFSVKDIAINEGKITKLTIVDRFGKTVYNWQETAQNTEGGTSNGTVENKPTEAKEMGLNGSNEVILKTFCTEKKSEPNIDQRDLLKFYNFYGQKAKDWKGTINPSILWQRWQTTKAY